MAEVVLPGDEICSVEEFLPGDGTYEKEGIVYAEVLGRVVRDTRERKVSVVPPKKPAKFNVPGSYVYGVVTQVMDQVAILHLYPYYTRRFLILPPYPYGSIHVSKVKKGYVETMRKEFRPGDWVRAKVLEIQKKYFIRLTTVGSELGLIRAYCPRCRTPMVRQGSRLRCPRCKYSEERKLASDYGNPKLPLQIKEVMEWK